ncbi:MAG: LptF/LptG family permease [SAR86 cluster bacterium]|uniref:LptF/LptG family permease n=1 Tax=SAR86 cluster bacterium TaxID=2030880 RepID=A0A520MV68_9GAMM|nr:MAG: LptF/LptG family permease [SAR86 cluster bacterium]
MNIVMHHSSQGMYKKNILSKSLNIEVLKSTAGVLLIFFFLVVSSRFVGYFEQASEGLIDPNLIYKIVILRFPDFITLLLPLSFFLGVVITMSRLYSDREIYGFFTGGLSEIDFLKYLLPQSLLFFFLTLLLSIYVAPYTKELSKEMISLDSLQEQFESIKPNQVFPLKNNEGFVFIKDKQESVFDEVVLYITNEDYSSIVVADQLSYDDLNSIMNLNFKNGSMYQGLFEEGSSVVSTFKNLKIPVSTEENSVTGLSFARLFDYSARSTKSQMQWNISIPITIFILLIIGINLSKVEPRQGRLSVLLPAIFVYILYLSLLILARESFDNNSAITQNYIWFVHFIFFIFSIFGLYKSSFNKTVDPFALFKGSNVVRLIFIGTIFIILLWIID